MKKLTVSLFAVSIVLLLAIVIGIAIQNHMPYKAESEMHNVKISNNVLDFLAVLADLFHLECLVSLADLVHQLHQCRLYHLCRLFHLVAL